mgnify:CR=1 FL=1
MGVKNSFSIVNGSNLKCIYPGFSREVNLDSTANTFKSLRIACLRASSFNISSVIAVPFPVALHHSKTFGSSMTINAST